MTRYSIQQPVGDDGRPIIGPTGRPLFIPHFQIPSYVVFDHEVDVRALGVYAFLQAFVDQSEGEVSSSITATDVATRFSVSEETVMRQTDRPKHPLGLVPRLARAKALIVGPNSVKTRDCEACDSPMAVPCPPSCTSRKGRRRIKPRFELANRPSEGFLHPGPLTRWEYYKPALVAKRLRENGQEREVVPFTQLLAWPALDRSIGLVELGAYVFVAAHTNLAEGEMATGDNLFRHAIARRFGWTEGHVSEVTAALERHRLISKAGLVHGHAHRYGHTGEPASYVVRVMPPAGVMHPGPLRLSEYRDPERITARQEAVRSVRSVGLRFPRVPPDLGIVDNSDYPQESTRGNPGLWTSKSGAVDEQIRDLGTHPSTHPGTHPSPSAQQPQPEGGVAHPRVCGPDGSEVQLEEMGRDATPSAAASDPMLALIERHVPKGLCRKGRADQIALLGLLQQLRGWGYGDERLRLVFHGVDASAVLNPWAVVYSRVRSKQALERHLRVLDLAAEEERVKQQAAVAPLRCLEHGLVVMEEVSEPGRPRCVECERRDVVEAQQASEVEVEEMPLSASVDSLAKAREASQNRGTKPLVAPRSSLSPVRPGEVITDLGLVEEVQWAAEHCGMCNPSGRYRVEVVPSGDQVDYIRVACRRCHC